MIVVQIQVVRQARGEGDTPLVLYASAGQANGIKIDPSEDAEAIQAALTDAVRRLERSAGLTATVESGSEAALEPSA